MLSSSPSSPTGGRVRKEGIEESWRHRSPRDPVAVGRVRLRRDTRERYEKRGEVEEPSQRTSTIV